MRGCRTDRIVAYKSRSNRQRQEGFVANRPVIGLADAPKNLSKWREASVDGVVISIKVYAMPFLPMTASGDGRFSEFSTRVAVADFRNRRGRVFRHVLRVYSAGRKRTNLARYPGSLSCARRGLFFSSSPGDRDIHAFAIDAPSLRRYAPFKPSLPLASPGILQSKPPSPRRMVCFFSAQHSMSCDTLHYLVNIRSAMEMDDMSVFRQSGLLSNHTYFRRA